MSNLRYARNGAAVAVVAALAAWAYQAVGAPEKRRFQLPIRSRQL